MRKFLVVAVLFLSSALMAVPAHAQEDTHVQVFGGYSYMRYNPADADVNLNGWDAAARFKLFRGLGIAGDFAGDYGSPGGVSGNVTTYMFGPEFYFPSRVSPFVHVLFGGGHLSVQGATDNSFAMGYGGGFDLHLSHNFGVRLFEIDDVYTRFGNVTQNSPRVSAGITLHF